MRRTPRLPFAERLLAALDAGEAAGGDKRGKQSAALRSTRRRATRASICRVDDHPEPLTELRRLHEVSKELFQPFLAFLPSRMNPAGIYDRAVIDAELARCRGAQRLSRDGRGGRRAARAKRGASHAAPRGARPQDLFREHGRRLPRGRRRELRARAGPHARPRRRVGLRQERHLALDHAAYRRPAGRIAGGEILFDGQRPAAALAAPSCASCAATGSR